MSLRRSPIEMLFPESSSSFILRTGRCDLAHPTEAVKLGAKGSGLAQWSAQAGLELPAGLYETRPAGEGGLIARIADDEIVLEAPPAAPEMVRMEEALQQGSAGIYRVDQQTGTFELSGPDSVRVLAEVCGVEFGDKPPDIMIFTRLAGVSCGVIPSLRESDWLYRIWVDYTYAPYLAETLAEIIAELK